MNDWRGTLCAVAVERDISAPGTEFETETEQLLSEMAEAPRCPACSSVAQPAHVLNVLVCLDCGWAYIA